MQIQPPSSSMEHETSLAIAPTSLPNARILVVEDARCIQKSIGSILQQLGLHVEAADNGKKACDLAEESKKKGSPYDLILMDIQMPVMKGCDATRWLREHGWEGPIVAISACSKESDLKRILEAGCDDCVAKPLNKEILQSLLATHLGEKAKP